MGKLKLSIPDLVQRSKMPEVCAGVAFDTVAREWRCKWSEDSDKASLVKAQEVLTKYAADLKKVAGVKDVQRVVCGGCHDFKVITSLDAGSFGAWGAAKFAPEEAFLAELGAISGITTVETQTFTLMPV